MTQLIIIGVDNKEAIICMADQVTKENMWDVIIGNVKQGRNKRKCDVKLNGENLGRVDYFEDAIQVIENKLGIKCNYISYKTKF